MFVEEGFRIRFANGEVIDFYAESREQKEAWMAVLAGTVGRDIGANKGWAAMVLAKERKEKAARPQASAQRPKPLQENANASRPQHQRTQSYDPRGHHSQSVPSSPVKGHSRTQSYAPVPPRKDVPIAKAPAPRPRDPVKSSRRDQVRSMIF